MKKTFFKTSLPAFGAAAAILLSCGTFARAGEALGVVTGNALKITRDGETILSLTPAYWGANWKYVGFKTTLTGKDGASVLETVGKSGDARIRFAGRIAPDGGKALKASWTLDTDRDTKSTIGIINMKPGNLVKKTTARGADGSVREIAGGYGRGGLGKSVASVALSGDAGVLATLRFEPPAEIASDGAARIILVAGDFAAATPRKLDITVELPDGITYYTSAADVPQEPGMAEWFTWRGTGAPKEKSALAMDDWLDKPAGRMGRIKSDGDTLKYGGRPIRLWGINLCYATCAPDKALAEKRAGFYARYGVNAVRLHKYADGTGWAGIQSRDSFADFDPVGLDKMDYFIAKLKEHGIYTKLSAHFGTPKLGAGDKAAVPYLEEFGKLGDKPGARVQIPASGVYYSREVQDVQIAHYVNLLRHRNPHTGMTYAEDPAIAFIEILNEQSALFYTSMTPLKASATLRADVGRRFCDWLRKKYRDHAGLVVAWGDKAFNSFGAEGFASSGEHLDANNILPLGNPWFWDPANLDTSQKFRRQRLLDSMTFLKGLQDEFNARFTKAVRATGYAGEIVASNWQAGRAYSHFMNLHSDALTGTIDRHNYFGGVDATMLDAPGSGMLSSGMQQVAGRPFMLSEWIHTNPSEFGAEGPALIGAYGMGLQGWDVSFMFQNRDNGSFSDRVGRDQWDVTAPQIMGLFPAVARQVLRGDVRESSVMATRDVSVPALAEGRLGFDDRVTQTGDVKEFTGVIKPAALAAVRCVVAFTEKFRETPAFDLSPYTPKQDEVVSSTKELRWTTGAKKHSGSFTIDTAGTQAIVGFANGRTATLSQTAITPETPFAAVYVTAAARNATVASANSLLITAIARARNTGAKIAGGTVLENGAAPILMEPVRAKIRLPRRPNPTVWVLDHDGCRTGEKVPVDNGVVVIDGAKYKTPYYEVTFGQ